MNDSTMQSMYKTGTPADSHAAAVAEKTGQGLKGAADILNSMLWILGSDDALGVAVNYTHIEQITTDGDQGRLRLYLPRSLVDITTDNIAELVALIGRRKLARLEVGKVGDNITISSISVYNDEKRPPKPENPKPEK